MKKHYLLTLLLSIVVSALHSQTFNYQWANTIGVNASNTTTDETVLITSALDASDNYYVAGYYYKTVDADPGAAATLLSSNGGTIDMYFAKYSPVGALVWANGIGGASSDYINSMAIDGSGNLYFGGYFNSATMDADPSAATVNLTTAGVNDAFFGKYSNAGAYVWAKNIGGTSDDYTQSIAVDASGNVYVGGYFSGTMDADPSATVANLVSTAGIDAFFAKYNSSGAYVWAKNIGGASTDYIKSIAVDASGNVYVGGYFNSATMDADPSASTANLTTAGAYDMFFAKYDASGNYLMAKNMGGTADDYLQSIALDATGNIYASGYFTTAMDADPAATTATLTSVGGVDCFFGKYTNAGVYTWAKNVGGTGTDYVQGMALDATGAVFITGYITSASMDADPGTGTTTITNAGTNGLYWSKYDAAGNYAFAMGASATGSTWGRSIAYSNNVKAAFIAGSHTSSPVDMDPGTATNNLTMVGNTAWATNGLFARYNCVGATPTVSISATATVICGPVSVTFTAVPVNGGTAPSYQWKKNSVNVGTNSATYVDGALLNNDVITCILTSNGPCLTVPTATSNAITITVVTSVTGSISIATPNTTVCAGTNVTFTATTVNPGPGPIYQWKRNGTNVGTNSSTYSNNALVNGDIISCVLTSNAPCILNPTLTSNNVTMTVNPTTVPSVSISVPSQTLCSGAPAVFTAVPTNGGSTPSYQWKVNGSNAGTNSATFSTSTLNNNDVVTCVLTSNATCTSPTTGTSNALTMSVMPPPPSTITYTGSLTFCSDDSVVLNAPTGAGFTYKWKLNGFDVVGGSNPTYGVHNSGSYTVTVTNSQNCSSTSAAVVVTVNQSPLVVITYSSPLSFCYGGAVVLSTYSTTPGYTYQWKNNNADIAGETNKAYVATTQGSYSIVITSNFGCVKQSAPVAVTVFPLPTPTINKTGTTFSTGAYSAYQWYYSFQPITGANGPTLTIGTDGPYNVAVTDANGCIGLSPVYYLNLLDINTVNPQAGVLVYPNPAFEKVYIKSDLPIRITVVDMHGKTMMKDEQKTEIDVREWANGLYYFSIFDKDHNLIRTDKLVKSGR